MINIHYNGKYLFQTNNTNSTLHITNEITYHLGIHEKDYYLIKDGKRYTDSHILQEECTIHIVPKLIGGKGGFGSMLRAIGAQIEKTTNREACRDLSGRRLRDINEEKRLKTWMTQQLEREKEAEDRRQKKLERLCEIPKHEFKDESYEKERSILTEKVEDALEQGLKASTSGTVKRKLPEEKAKTKKKKIWLGSEDEFSSSSDVDSDDNEQSELKKSEIVSSEEIVNKTPEENDTSTNVLTKQEDKEAMLLKCEQDTKNTKN